ncbi:MAG TPA: hypothetical protein PKV33_07485 [Methanothrix sp.]|nr:hypothetical protein [Methanothrix sp.]
MRLNDDQRGKLINREQLTEAFDVRKRRENEFAVRNHLKSFLEFIPDACVILDNLPRSQLKNNEKLAKYLNDEAVNGLFLLTLKLLDLLDYMPIQGTPRRQCVTKIGETEGDVIARYANENDLKRNWLVHNQVVSLSEFYQTDFNLLTKCEGLKAVKKHDELRTELEDPKTIKAIKDAGMTPEMYIKFMLSRKEKI